MKTLLEAALEYAGRGYPVFPLYGVKNGRCECSGAACEHPGKHPRTAHGLKDATTDVTEITKWWSRWGNANIALITGTQSGFIVLDVDKRNGGMESLERLKKLNGGDFKTLVVRSGGGGLHYYFKHPGGGVVIKSKPLDGFKGVDIRGDNGSIIAAGSTHASGGVYEIAAGSFEDIAPLPQCLQELLIKPHSANSNTGIGESIPQGERNHRLTGIAGALRRQGLSETALCAALKEINKTECKPPLSDMEVETIAKSVSRYERKEHIVDTAMYSKLPKTTASKIMMVNAAELQKQAGEGFELPYLPFLGVEGYIVKGWSHIVAAYPKVGKTELLFRLCLGWNTERILYFTEEPQQLWATRLAQFTQGIEHITLAMALGAEQQEILEAVKQRPHTLIIIDTVRNLLNLQDENNNSEIARVLNPFIAACRVGNKTLIMAHHDSKAGGEHGKGITGGHAFLGVADIALEINFAEGNNENRRKVTGLGRVFHIPQLLYEMSEDGSFVALGSPSAVGFSEVKQRALDTVDDEFRLPKEIIEMMEDPKPSLNHVRNALKALYKEEKVECDNPDGGKGKPQRFRRAQRKEYTGIPNMYSLLDGDKKQCNEHEGTDAGDTLDLVKDVFPDAKTITPTGTTKDYDRHI